MTVRYAVIKDDKAIDAHFKKARTIVEDFKKEFLYECAGFVITRSPVDTGVYITSHEIRKGRSGGSGFTTSFGKPRKQSYRDKSKEGMNKLRADIESIDLESSDFITIVNIALHAYDVEYEHGDAPYTSLRNASRELARKAASKAKAK